MGLELHQDAPEAAPVAPLPPSPPPVPAAAGRKAAKPVDPAKREAAAKKAAVRRRVRQLERAKDVEELERLWDTQAGKVRPANTDATAPVAEAKPTGRPGWPTEEAIRAQLEPAEFLWSNAQKLLKGTRYEFDAKGKDVLVGGTAPVLAKWMPAIGDTPEAAFVVAVGMVFLGPALQHLAEVLDKKAAAPKPLLEERAA